MQPKHVAVAAIWRGASYDRETVYILSGGSIRSNADPESTIRAVLDYGNDLWSPIALQPPTAVRTTVHVKDSRAADHRTKKRPPNLQMLRHAS
jgi:hypothetical protein